MKITHLVTALVAAAIPAIPSLTQAQTNGTWNTVISPSAGGTKTSISFYGTGDWLTGFTFTGSGPSHSGQAIGLSGLGTSPSNAWTMPQTNFVVAPLGYITNLTQGVSRSLTNVGFAYAGGPLFFALYFSSLPSANGDTLAWVFDATPTELEVDLAFSNFTPGTYNTADPFNPSSGYQYNMEIVPEPSTYTLLALSAAGLGGYVLRRRRK